eukprot:PhM_4_TR939/c0_g1_i1/m.87571
MSTCQQSWKKLLAAVDGKYKEDRLVGMTFAQIRTVANANGVTSPLDLARIEVHLRVLQKRRGPMTTPLSSPSVRPRPASPSPSPVTSPRGAAPPFTRLASKPQKTTLTSSRTSSPVPVRPRESIDRSSRTPSAAFASPVRRPILTPTKTTRPSVSASRTASPTQRKRADDTTRPATTTFMHYAAAPRPAVSTPTKPRLSTPAGGYAERPPFDTRFVASATSSPTLRHRSPLRAAAPVASSDPNRLTHSRPYRPSSVTQSPRRAVQPTFAMGCGDASLGPVPFDSSSRSSPLGLRCHTDKYNATTSPKAERGGRMRSSQFQTAAASARSLTPAESNPNGMTSTSRSGGGTGKQTIFHRGGSFGPSGSNPNDVGDSTRNGSRPGTPLRTGSAGRGISPGGASQLGLGFVPIA